MKQKHPHIFKEVSQFILLLFFFVIDRLMIVHGKK